MVEKFNMPWEDRPAGCTDVMWRYSKNPRYWTLSNSFVKQYIQQRSCSV